jgi:cellulose synthase/poly-beta-1,6-N-acetylglucosamine synthase-like glycosyltransferase
VRSSPEEAGLHERAFDGPFLAQFWVDSSFHDCPEIDFLRPLISADTLAHAAERAAILKLGADRVLIASGAIDEETYVRRLSHSLGVAFEPLENISRSRCPLTDDQLIESARVGIMPLRYENETHFIVAPYGNAAHKLATLLPDNEAVARKFKFTTSAYFKRFILRCAGQSLIDNASEALKHRWPTLSAAPQDRNSRAGRKAITAGLAIIAAFIAIFTSAGALSVFFLSWFALRILCVCKDKRKSGECIPRLRDAELPTYSIIAALYDEAESVDGLLRSIEQLDYPHEKLDVILAVEADDTRTLSAIEARKTRIQITVIASPPMGPRTKPKALNVALPFARGAFLVVFDAEDRPERDQLRRALHAFRSADRNLACVQARLCIDNTNDSWLARMFTAEYAGHFDAFLGGLANMRLPVPLGGSSNHFRIETLRKIGAWDPYNVTEDADLGIRLTRFGYRSEVIFSTTYEEAPGQFGPWLRQRTRWFKGWMQTWAVHMRHPLRLKNELGFRSFATFQFIVGGNALAALVHPLFLAFALSGIFRDGPLTGKTALYGAVALAGYLTTILLGWIGLARRGLSNSAWVLLLAPLHWLLLSTAAWRALYQVLVAPYVWEKTRHGLAKSSRRAKTITRSLLSLERHLREMSDSGLLPALSDNPQIHSNNRQQNTRIVRAQRPSEIADLHAPAKGQKVSPIRRFK